MKIVGIIIESNPFHKGHEYLIKKVMSELKPDLMVALSSGYFTMRGEISLLNKINKTKILLNSGFDLVIDFPLYDLLNSSDYFGENALRILNDVGITDLAFGIEHENITILENIVNLMDSSSFNDLFREKLNTNISYKKAFEETIKSITNLDQNLIDITMKSNNTLALSYIKAIKKYPHIKPYAIKRHGNFEENTSLESFPSGTALRDNYLQNKNISKYLPYDTSLLSDLSLYDIRLKTLFDSLTLKKANHFQELLHINEGIENYILKNYDFKLSIDENLNNLSSKTYSKSRLRRTLLSMILEIPKNINTNQQTIRILGFTKKGESYLKHINGNLIMNIAKQSNDIIQLELRSSKLYDILTNQSNYKEEFKFPLKGE